MKDYISKKKILALLSILSCGFVYSDVIHKVAAYRNMINLASSPTQK